MTEQLSGLVAILNDDGSSVIEVRDLGPEPVSVKPGRVLPIVDAYPVLIDRQQYGDDTFTIEASRVVRSREVVSVPLADLEPWRFFSALELSGYKPALYSFFDDQPAPLNVIMRNRFEHASSFRRADELVIAAQQALNIDDATLDAIWSQALSFPAI